MTMHKHPSAVSSGWRDWIVVRMYVQGGMARVCVRVCSFLFLRRC